MKLCYYPGCTLRTKAKDLDTYARRCASALGFELWEPEEWQCCGGVFVTSKDEIATKLAGIWVLSEAKRSQLPLLTVCSACHNVIKQTNHAMQTDAEFASRVNAYLSADCDFFKPYNGETQVWHYLELLRDVVGFDELSKKVKNSLNGKKIASYYGCLLLRPGKIMGFDDPENPRIMEDLVRALGGEPVIYPMRNECCGGYAVMDDPSNAKKQSTGVLDSAKTHGAELIVTACPLCKYNLQKLGSDVPVIYFTELLADALGVKEDFDEHKK